MGRVQTKSLLHYIRGVIAEADAEDLTDRELLERFSSRHDEIAFKTIVRRHGPMVLRICHRILARREDAEDAFQATFLVLARRSVSLKWRESIGAWLYEVAHRVGMEARRKEIGRQNREAAAPSRPNQDPLAEINGRELVGILDKEVAAMPERYRAPLLFHLEGKGDDEAAHILGCSLSTFKRRLRHARQLLKRQLERRGFALSVGLSALILCNAASASISPSLVASTVAAVALQGTGKPLAAGLVSAQALTLANMMARTALLAKVKWTLAALLVGGGLLAGTWTRGYWNPASQGDSESKDKVKGAEISWKGFDQRPARNMPVTAAVETSLATAAGQIRQFAFDGDPNTFFASVQSAGPADHFTLVFDKPVAVQTVAVTTGRPKGGDALDAGTLEMSENGKDFESLAAFINGAAVGHAKGRLIQAVRVRPTKDLNHPLAVREFVVKSDPPVSVFKYPVEFTIDVSDAPEMREWAEKAARVCERAYPMMNDELRNDGFKPTHVIKLALKKDFEPIAQSEGHCITGSVRYFQAHPDDLGALVHTTVFSAQDYPDRKIPGWLSNGAARFAQVLKCNNSGQTSWKTDDDRPSRAKMALLAVLDFLGKDDQKPDWLVQGIADYVRFFKYEPGTLGPIDPERDRYNSDSRKAAMFLAFLADHYDKDIVRKLNRIVRERKYTEKTFATLTGKTLEQLDEEWRSSQRGNQKAAKGSVGKLSELIGVPAE